MDQLAIAQAAHAKAAYRILHAEDIGLGVARAIPRGHVRVVRVGSIWTFPASVVGPGDGRGRGQGASLREVVDLNAGIRCPRAAAVDRALEVLKSAKKPLMIIGKGAAYAQCDDKVRELCRDDWRFPYLAHVHGQGAVAGRRTRNAPLPRGRWC